MAGITEVRNNASILREMQNQKGNERCQVNQDEERQTCNSGGLPDLRN